MEQVESFKFLGVHINNKLEWSKHTKTVVKRARQSLFPLRKQKRFGMGPEILKRFYNCNIESMVGCITAWYGICSASDRKALQRVVRTAQYITGAQLPAIQDLYTRRCQRKALKIAKDYSHPSYRLVSLLLHGKRYRIAKSRCNDPLPVNDWTKAQREILSIYHTCIVTLTIHSCTYYLNWPDQPVLPHIGLPGYLHYVPPPANPSFALLLLSVHHICIVTLTIPTCTYYLNQPD